MGVRSTQEAVEVVVVPVATMIRVSQEALETVYAPPVVPIYVSQESLEVVLGAQPVISGSGGRVMGTFLYGRGTV